MRRSEKTAWKLSPWNTSHIKPVCLSGNLNQKWTKYCWTIATRTIFLFSFLIIFFFFFGFRVYVLPSKIVVKFFIQLNLKIYSPSLPLPPFSSFFHPSTSSSLPLFLCPITFFFSLCSFLFIPPLLISLLNLFPLFLALSSLYFFLTSRTHRLSLYLSI